MGSLMLRIAHIQTSVTDTIFNASLDWPIHIGWPSWDDIPGMLQLVIIRTVSASLVALVILPLSGVYSAANATSKVFSLVSDKLASLRCPH